MQDNEDKETSTEVEWKRITISGLGDPTPCAMDIESFPVVKRPGRGVNYPPHVVTKLKKEWSCNCIPPLCVFMAGYRVNLTFTFTGKNVFTLSCTIWLSRKGLQ